ncbi:MAG: hypothetical protein K6U14_05160 [Firmicutes bacterium]|nr:hypothetical protein [Alicyclobacillaceae bacterium]MCL6497007.1 hypothetical protein [Bacillota bacterium]
MAPLLLTATLGASAYAFMASNSVAESSAGAGQGTITGYTVTDIQYDLNALAPDPGRLWLVTFDLVPSDPSQPATQVAVWFDNQTQAVASTWYHTCQQTFGPDSQGVTGWSCGLQGWDQEAGPGPTATMLNVAAAH